MSPRMNIEKDKCRDDYEGFTISDSKARLILSTEQPYSDMGATLLEIARNTSDVYSFIAHQTYPRPKHPLLHKRLRPEFTFTAIIISLRCTLETEQRVVNSLIELTQGNLNTLNSIELSDLEHIIRPAGMARQKSLWIKEGLEKFNSSQACSIETLRHMPAEDARRKLLELKGMGPKAVDCFLLLGLDIPVFPVDVNVFKLVSRLFPEHITGNPYTQPSFSNAKHVRSAKILLESNFTQDTKLYQILHTYLLLAEKYKIAI